MRPYTPRSRMVLSRHLRDDLQNLVASGAAVQLVEYLETFDIELHDGERFMGTGLEQFGGFAAERSTVVQAREAVVFCRVKELLRAMGGKELGFAQRCLQLLPFKHVLRDDVVDASAGDGRVEGLRYEVICAAPKAPAPREPIRRFPR